MILYGGCKTAAQKGMMSRKIHEEFLYIRLPPVIGLQLIAEPPVNDLWPPTVSFQPLASGFQPPVYTGERAEAEGWSLKTGSQKPEAGKGKWMNIRMYNI